MSEVTLIIIPYTHPPRHGQQKVRAMLMNADLHPFRYVWIGPPIPEKWLF